VPDPLYHRLLQRNSLTHRPDTGFGSPASDAERATNARLYGRVFPEYLRYMEGQLSKDALIGFIRTSCQANVLVDELQELEVETTRLRRLLE